MTWYLEDVHSFQLTNLKKQYGSAINRKKFLINGGLSENSLNSFIK